MCCYVEYDDWCWFPGGVRQGGVLSPFLFAIYIDDIIVQMRNPGLGIRIGSRPIFAGCLLYADDIVVISYSYYGLQKLINIVQPRVNVSCTRIKWHVWDTFHATYCDFM